MQIAFEDGGVVHELDVTIGNPSATVADLVAALAPDGAGQVDGIRIGDRAVPLDHGLDECGLHEGAVVSLLVDRADRGGRADWADRADRGGRGGRGGRADWADQPDAAGAGPTRAAPATMELHLVNGLEAGRRFPLAPGRHLVGRSAQCAVRLGAPTVSRRHALLEVTVEGEVKVCDAGSRNGTWIDGRALVGDEARTLPQGSTVRWGAIEAELRPPRRADRPTGIDPLRFVNGGGTIPFNRSPRDALPVGPAPEPVPEGPATAARTVPVLGIATFAPLLAAGGMIAMTGDVRYGAFAALSPVVAVFGAIDRRRQGRRDARSDARRFREQLATFDARLAMVGDAERARRASLAPDAAEVARRAALPSTRLWERVRSDPGFDDFLVLRAGIGDVRWPPPVIPARQPHEDSDSAVESASVLARSPVLIDLAGGGAVGVVGDRAAALAVARSLVCQAAVHHGPAELAIVVCAASDAADDWDWTKWLPHTRDASGPARRLSGSAARSAELLTGIVRAGRHKHDDPRPTLLLVIDDESLTEGRRAPARTLLRGGADPVAGIVVATAADRLPAMCTTVLTLTGPDGLADLERPQAGERLDGFLATGMDDPTARRCARELARFEDPELEIAGAGLPDRVRLLPLLELDAPTPGAIARRWARRGPHPHPETPVGVSDAGVFTIDLVRDGPHALVAGTTGAGKSELLRTLVAGLAASVDPDHLTFVLIDFKGGSAFDECSRLPHTVGMLTDLDQHLCERALRCLEAELRHRERVLRDTGVSDLAGYQQAGTPLGPLPRLFVVVDEFATLLAELPEVVDALVGVAQRGRSLGVHLLLATQRPGGAVSANIKANTNLRVALRVQDSTESTDVLGVADAAAIPRSRAGRALVRLGPGEIVAIQTAMASANDAIGDVAPVEARPFAFGAGTRPLPPPATDAPGTRSDLRLLVELIQQAFAAAGRPLPRRPWPEPLPPRVELDAILPAARTGGALPAEVIVALADDPDQQRQVPFGWRPADGNLLLYGIVGSGTTTAAATVALALARSADADRCHLYVLDLGAGELGPLAGLPHCGAVVAAGEGERQRRLVRGLRAELDRRRQLGAAAVEGEPAVVTIVDGYATLVAEYADPGGHQVLDDLLRVIADGPDVRLYAVLTADRIGSVPSAVASLVRQKLLFRLADAGEYAAARLPVRRIPELPPGRALVAGSAMVVQVATPPEPLADAVAAVAAAVPAPRHPPAAVPVLPRHVHVDEVAGATRLGARPWFIAVARRERDLEPAGLTVYAGEHAVIAGGARAGKTTTLAAIAASVRAADPAVAVIVVAGARSALPALARPARTFGPHALAGALDAVDTDRGRVLLLVDDAEGVGDEDGRLEALVTGGPADLLVVAAGRPDVLRGTYHHWTRAVRRSQLGVLLQPSPELDGELFAVHLPRRAPVAMVRGRGYLVNGGQLELGQVAAPEDVGG